MDKMVIPNRGRVVAVMVALALAGGLLTLALLAKPSQAQGQGATSERIPISYLIDATECTGELINIEGTMHIVNHFVATEGDGHHIISHFNLQSMTGVGLDPITSEPTGTEYAVPARTQAVENFLPTGDQVTGDVVMQMVIGKGEIPNQNFVSQMHYIITSEGEVKVETINFHLECQE